MEQQNMSLTIGFVGAGRMGDPMIRRLVAAGHRVNVFDTDPERVESLASDSVRPARSAAEAAGDADVVFLSLPTPEAVAIATESQNGVIGAMQPGSLLIDLSTVDPATSRRLAWKCAGSEIRFLEAPVSGGVQAAEAGTLTMMVGGSADVLDPVRGLLGDLAANIVLVGAFGEAQMAKLCNNMLAAVHTAALGEVIATGLRCGLDFDALNRVLSTSSGSSHVLTHYFPVTVLTEERPTRFSLNLMQKDIDLYLRAARSSGSATPLAGTIQGLYDLVRLDGGGERDATSIVEYFERLAGVHIATSPPQVGGGNGAGTPDRAGAQA